VAQLAKALPEKEFSGIGGISTSEHTLNYFSSAAAPRKSAPPPCSTTPSART
jgi:hypothetical protein